MLERDNIRGINGMSNVVTGGDYCWRANTFGDSTKPTSAALEHREIAVSLLYRYVIEKGGYGEAAMLQAAQWANDHPSDPSSRDRHQVARFSRGEERERDRAFGLNPRPRPRSRSSNRARNRSRSRSRSHRR